MRITANQITVARILALPFPCWALITRPSDAVMWVAFVFGVIVGATDFVDGWLARRDGPTTLGSLLDPVADKLFMAMLLLPVVAHNECPGWAAGALFVRELLITSLRSSMAVRKHNLKTSSLGKLKTVVQMGGIAAFFLTIFVPEAAMPWTHLGWATIFVGIAVVWIAIKRTWPLWLIATPILLYFLGGLAFVLPVKTTATVVFVLMVFFTWVSGADYLVGATRAFLSTGGLSRFDVGRIAWSLAHGLALVPLLGAHPAIVVPVILSLSAELSLGGVDNLVSAERGRFARGTIWPTTIVMAAVGGLTWSGHLAGAPLLYAAWGVAVLSLANLAVGLWLDRDVFADPHVAAPSPLPSPSPSPSDAVSSVS